MFPTLVLSGAGVTSPAHITGLAGWWKADSITGLADGTQVDTWSDSSSNGRNATQTGAGRPTFKTNILNGLPVVRFDGGDHMIISSYTHGSKFAIFAVVIENSTTGTQYVFEQGTSSSQQVYLWKDGSQVMYFGYHDGTTWRDYTKTWSPTVGVAYILDGGTGATNNVVGISGTTDSTPARTGYPVSASQGANIGRSFSLSSGYFNGDIAEIIIYNADLSIVERALVRNYLSRKWGVTL